MRVTERNKSLHDEFSRDPERRRLLLEEDLLNNVAEKICSLLEMKGLTRADLARALYRTKGFVTQILRAKNLTLRTVSNVADALDCEIELSFVPRADAGFLRGTLFQDEEPLVSLMQASPAQRSFHFAVEGSAGGGSEEAALAA